MYDRIDISAAITSDDVQQVRALFLEYETFLGISLCFQGFQAELATLPGDYAPPEGCLLIARYGEHVAGCAGVRKFSDGIGEMKRLYVRPEYQGLKVGRALAESVIQHACKVGYARIRLDTLPELDKAISLYKSLGFHEIAPYRDYQTVDAIFMELALI